MAGPHGTFHMRPFSAGPSLAEAGSSEHFITLLTQVTPTGGQTRPELSVELSVEDGRCFVSVLPHVVATGQVWPGQRGHCSLIFSLKIK